ncbi:uncharacterized protein LOC133802109 [Humulus lupulus]|uniref:uncharacterized protein LOC133802109 n=1 Tax=Humulus lupulus TaxID=3486 RepID=UPI002B40BE35|nr:uncharacterized protein LOC133802109 [Humulus lupulus]
MFLAPKSVRIVMSLGITRGLARIRASYHKINHLKALLKHKYHLKAHLKHKYHHQQAGAVEIQVLEAKKMHQQQKAKAEIEVEVQVGSLDASPEEMHLSGAPLDIFSTQYT